MFCLNTIICLKVTKNYIVLFCYSDGHWSAVWSQEAQVWSGRHSKILTFFNNGWIMSAGVQGVPSLFYHLKNHNLHFFFSISLAFSDFCGFQLFSYHFKHCDEWIPVLPPNYRCESQLLVLPASYFLPAVMCKVVYQAGGVSNYPGRTEAVANTW